MLARIRAILSVRVLYSVLGVTVAAAVIMLVSPLLRGGMSISGGIGATAGAMLFIPLCIGAANVVRARSQQAINARVSQALSLLGNAGGQPGAPPASGAPSAASASARQMRDPAANVVDVLNARFRDAMAILKHRRFASATGRRWLYQLPWYIMIGPPGSGKTTAITNSGLTFPLADRLGKVAVSGIGGTRNCDWWFTDEAVLIDTAGRYTTQDSNAEQDKAGWLGFLGLLKKYRRRQPLNGVLVAIGISDLGDASDEVRADHATRIRQRVKELYHELGARLPVYVLFTKADLIAGFSEFFDDLGREGRESVWGLSFQPETPDPQGGIVARYDDEFDALVARLDERMLERVQQEGDFVRRAAVFGFPQQVLSLKEVTGQFLRETFQSSSFDDPILLRGVYFVSGMQAGTPLDRVTDAMARTFGIIQPAPPALAGQRRSYFLNRLLREVVFGEAGLVDADPRIARRLRRLRQAAYAVTALGVAAISAVWLASYLLNAALISRVQAAATKFDGLAANLKLERVADSDLRSVVQLLDILRDVSASYGDDHAPRMLRADFGLDQGTKLAAQTRSAYRHALNAILLPRLVLRLESELAAHNDDPDFLYEALKVYLMLGRQGPLDPASVKRWMALDFTTDFAAERDASLRRSLAAHVDALLEAPTSDIALNGELIDTTRALLARTPLAQRVLNVVVNSPQARSLSPFTIADHAGPAAEAVLRRRSGESINAGLPGIYTRTGFFGVFLPLLPEAAAAAMQGRWVIDPRPLDVSAGTGGPPSTESLERDATALYLQSFGLQWDHLLGDITVAATSSLDDSLRVLNALSAPTSPIRLLVVSMAGQTSLDRPPATPKPEAGDAATSAASPADNLARLFERQAPGDTPSGMAAQYTQQHFKALHDLVEIPPDSVSGAQPPIDRTVRDLGVLYQSLSQLRASAGSSSPQLGASDAALTQIEAGAGGLPEPVKHWVLGISRVSSNQSLGQEKDRLVSLWAGTAGQLCRRTTEARYPFVRSAENDAPLNDFARLFGRNGAIDAFFTEKLMPTVDMSHEPWKWRSQARTGAVMDSASLSQFEHAAAIRDSMFATDGATPSAGFQLALSQVDGAVDTVTFAISDKSATYKPGGQDRVRFTWSGDPGVASVTVTRPGGPPPATISASGPWALFRLLDKGGVQASGAPERLQVRFTVDGLGVTFLLTADNSLNPFSGRLLPQFHCPKAL